MFLDSTNSDFAARYKNGSTTLCNAHPDRPGKGACPLFVPCRLRSFVLGFLLTAGDDIPVRNHRALQVLQEKVRAAAIPVCSILSVVCSRYQNKVKVLLGFYESIDDTIGRFGRHIGVQLSQYQQQSPLQFVGIVDVRVGGVMRPHKAHPGFIPTRLVKAIVVATARRHGDFVKIRMEQDAPIAFCPPAEVP